MGERKRIAISVVSQTIDDMLKDFDTVVDIQKKDKHHEYIIEARADYLKKLDGGISRLAKHNGLKKIFTARHKNEAGNDKNAGFKGDEKERTELYHTAIDSGFDYIDFEHNHPIELSELSQEARTKVKIIRSFHNFEKGNCKDLQFKYYPIAKAKPDIVKIAMMISTKEDSYKIAVFPEKTSVPTIAVPMGKAWHVPLARIISLYHKGYLSFACLPGKEAAKGQIDAYKFRELSLRVSEIYEKEDLGVRKLNCKKFSEIGKQIGL